jgi:hypothetical protein
MNTDDCDHEIVNMDGKSVCVLCDMIMTNQLEQGFENRGYSSKSSSKTGVLDRVEGIPEEVKSAARVSINRKGEFFPKNVRDDAKNTFRELYITYQELKIPFDPDELAEKLGLERKKIHSCLKMVSGTSLIPSTHDDGEKYCCIVMIHPVNMIEDKCKLNNLEEYTDILKDITRYILSDDKNPDKVSPETKQYFIQAKPKPWLIQSKPRHIACAIIKKFCDRKGISTKSFVKVNKISDNALKNAIRDIEDYF